MWRNRRPAANRRRLHPITAALLVALALLVTACTSTPGSGDGGYSCSTPVGSYTGEQRLYAAYCDAMERCGIDNQMGYSFSCLGQCVQTFEFSLGCGVSESEDDLDLFNMSLYERQVVYDEERGAECVAWWASASCDDVERIFLGGDMFGSNTDSEDTPGIPEACEGVLEILDGDGGSPPGEAIEGEACDGDWDCGEGLFCDQPNPDADVEYCYVCTPLPGAGEPCRDYSCGEGSFCDTTVDPYMCRATLPGGEACESNNQCTSQSCYEGFCFDLLPDGEPCVTHQQCESFYCFEEACLTRLEEGEPCDDDGVCVSMRCYQNECIEVLQNGEPCEDNAQCWSSCYRGECIPDRAEGEPCDEDANCQWNAVCYEGSCVQSDELPVGAPCENEYVCVTNLCIDNVCAQWRENGESCAVDEECISRICFDGGCGLPDGEACSTSASCRSGRCPSDTVCITPLADGQPCTYAEECSSWTCLDGSCFTYLDQGDECDTTTQCRGGMFCDPESGLCTSPRLNGEPCTIDGECRYDYCDTVAELCGYPDGEPCSYHNECQGFCDSAAGECTARLEDGVDCTEDEECVGYCVYGSCRALKPYGVECVYDYECEGGSCVYGNSRNRCIGPGECFESEHCEPGEYCNGDEWPQLCSPPKANGEDCESDEECQNYCHNVCVALRPYGDDCVEDEECANGLCDEGRCAIPGECYSDEECDDGQFCDRNLYHPLCSDPKPDGSYCEDDEECLSGWCSFQTETCKVRPEHGDPCQSWECAPDSYCLNGICEYRKAPGARCDSTFYSDAECLGPAVCRNGRCQVMPLTCEPAQAGQMCTLLMICDEDSYCDMLDGFTCKRRSHVGEECQSMMWAETCEVGSQCVSGICEAYATLGESCAERSCEPRETYCDSETNTCRPRKYAGEPCVSDSECLGGYCGYWGDDEYRCDGPCRMPE